MTDPRIGLGYEVEPVVHGPWSLHPGGEGTLDRGIVAQTKSGEKVVIGEIWAAAVGAKGTKVRVDSVAIAEALVAVLNRNITSLPENGGAR